MTLVLLPLPFSTSYVMLQVTEHPLVSLSWSLSVELQSLQTESLNKVPGISLMFVLLLLLVLY